MRRNLETKLDKQILSWLQESKPLIINYDDTYGDEYLKEALMFLDGGDIGALNHYILTDQDNISSYKKDTITYSKIVYYANKIAKEKLQKTIDNDEVKTLEEKRYIAIGVLDTKDEITIGYRQKFLEKFDEKEINFFIKDKPLFSDTEKEVIKIFGVNSFFDSSFNYEIKQKIKDSFLKYKENILTKQLTLKSTKTKTKILGNSNDR